MPGQACVRCLCIVQCSAGELRHERAHAKIGDGAPLQVSIKHNIFIRGLFLEVTPHRMILISISCNFESSLGVISD